MAAGTKKDCRDKGLLSQMLNDDPEAIADCGYIISPDPKQTAQGQNRSSASLKGAFSSDSRRLQLTRTFVTV